LGMREASKSESAARLRGGSEPAGAARAAFLAGASALLAALEGIDQRERGGAEERALRRRGRGS
jgi:hypothetical protein